MAYCLGIDPGKTGAIAIYGPDCLMAFDMPTHLVQVGNSRRERVDPLGVRDLLDGLNQMYWPEMAVIEAVGGRPRQGAAAAFTFGWSAAVPYCGCLWLGIRVEAVTPGQWKKWMKVPGKANESTSVMKRAMELFPADYDQFKGPKGGARVDRAEAAMLAKFGAEALLNRPSLGDPEGRLSNGGGNS